MTLALIVSVDTEEEFDWSATGCAPRWSLDHLPAIPRFQQLCDSYGVRPTYVVDYPIATSPAAAEMFRGYLQRNACEVGAHLHPWVNPPINEEINPRNTYLCNLPLELQAEKVTTLTAAIRNSMGISPTSFKAGRYGIDFALTPHLQQLGYTVDSSVIAYTNYSDDEGPDFSHYASEPFWIGNHRTAPANGQTSVLEVPCTVGFSRRPAQLWSQVHRFLSQPRLRFLHPVGILDRTKLLRKIVLSPELASAADLITLMRVFVRAGATVLNLTLHSPSLAAGYTPFVRTKDDLARFYDALSRALEFATTKLKAQSFTLSEYRNFVLRNCET